MGYFLPHTILSPQNIIFVFTHMLSALFFNLMGISNLFSFSFFIFLLNPSWSHFSTWPRLSARSPELIPCPKTSASLYPCIRLLGPWNSEPWISSHLSSLFLHRSMWSTAGKNDSAVPAVSLRAMALIPSGKSFFERINFFRALLSLQQNGNKVERFPSAPHMHTLPHYQHNLSELFVAVVFYPRMKVQWRIITQSTEFPLGSLSELYTVWVWKKV